MGAALQQEGRLDPSQGLSANRAISAAASKTNWSLFLSMLWFSNIFFILWVGWGLSELIAGWSKWIKQVNICRRQIANNVVTNGRKPSYCSPCHFHKLTTRPQLDDILISRKPLLHNKMFIRFKTYIFCNSFKQKFIFITLGFNVSGSIKVSKMGSRNDWSVAVGADDQKIIMSEVLYTIDIGQIPKIGWDAVGRWTGWAVLEGKVEEEEVGGGGGRGLIRRWLLWAEQASGLRLSSERRSARPRPRAARRPGAGAGWKLGALKPISVQWEERGGEGHPWGELSNKVDCMLKTRWGNYIDW